MTMALELTDYGRELTAALEKIPGLGWEIRQVQERSHQLYLVFDEVESQRQVAEEKYYLRLYLRHTANGQEVLGESGWTANPEDDYHEALAQALERAPVVANPLFELPGPPQEYHPLVLADPRLRDQPEAVLWQVRHELTQAVGPEAEVTLAGAELFTYHRQIAYWNHTGLHGSYEETALQVQFALLAAGNGEEVECLGWRETPFLGDLDLTAYVRRYSRYARDQLQAELPPSGCFPVVLGEEALETIFDHLVAQASGEARFQGWSRLTPGASVIKDPRGDLLTLSSDPWLPGGLASRPFDQHGLALRPVTFIAANLFQQPLADKRYADYLGLPPTGPLTNLRVAPGRTPQAELLTGSSVLELLRFSTLEPNPVTGALSGEIRTGYLHHRGRRQPIKGGALTAMLDEAFRDLTLSRETVLRGTYEGPAAIRFQAMEISGA